MSNQGLEAIHNQSTSCQRGWSSFTLKEDEKGFLQIGPLSLWVTRYLNEWKISWKTVDEPLNENMESIIPFNNEVPSSLENIERYGLQNNSGKIIISPTLPDRPVVAKPAIPFYIPPHEKVTLYITIPLVAQIEIGEGRKKLTSIPTYQLSDTWFGPPNHEGEICYAVKTNAKLRLQDLPIRHFRSVTAIQIINDDSTKFLLEKIKLPLSHFSLFRSKEGFYCTESVKLRRIELGEEAHLTISDSPHPEAGETQKIEDPIIKSNNRHFVKKFYALFN